MSFLRTASVAAPVVTPQFTGLQVQTASSALPIPIVYGRTRVAPNIVWSRNFQSHAQYGDQPQSGKGGFFSPSSGGSGITGYTYTTSIMMGLCEGPIAALGTAFDGQDVYESSDFVNLLPGTTPQAPWGLLSARYPNQALGYGGTALAVSPSYDLGSNASIGSISFEVAGLLHATSPVSNFDADPAAAIDDFLTSPQYGVGFPAASLDAPALYGVYQAYCTAHGLGISPALTDQETASSILARWLQLTNATGVWSGGRLKILPYGDGAAAVCDLDDDDFVYEDGADPVIVTRSDPTTASNVIIVEALDRANQYAPTTIEARDQGSIERTGLRQGATVTAHEFCNPAAAATSAQLMLQRGLYIRNSYAFKLSWEYGLLEPMDVVTLTDAGLGLARTPVRIVEIAEDEQGLLAVTAEEHPGQVGTSAGFPVDSAANAPIQRSIAPAPVNPPVILEPPSELTNGVPQLWLGLSGGTGGIADPNWGGAAIFASADDATYVQVGLVTGPARQGVLKAALGAPGGPGDVLSVDFAASGASVLAPAQPALVAVDGEIMSFASAVLTGTGTYALGGLERGLYGQRGGAHSVGAPVLILDKAVFTYLLPPSAVGVPLWLKFASVNTFGRAMQDLSTCAAYQVTPVGSGAFGPVAQAIATGTSLDEGLASASVDALDDFGLASDLYTKALDMGSASEAATALAVQSGGTGATSPSIARQNIGAAVSGANADIASLTNLQGLGIGMPVDTGTNKLSVRSAAVLFDHAGGGVQHKINKAGVSDSATIHYQTGTSGRAQAGLIGSDRYRVAVSATGSSFRQAFDVDPTTGNVGLAGYTADANNALGVLGTNFLFGASVDSCRFVFSKSAPAHDAALSFQTSFSARALAGLLGSDGYQLKVSPDGSTFYQVYVCDQATGNAAFKALLAVASYAVAALPSGFNGALAFATNGRKAGEAAGAGTGVIVAFSGGQWRRLSDDTVVAA